MSTIRLTKHLTSDTLHLPELRSLIGQDVEISIRPTTEPAGDEWWNPPSLDEIARRQGIAPITSTAQLRGSLPADAFDGFEEARESWRQEDLKARQERDRED